MSNSNPPVEQITLYSADAPEIKPDSHALETVNCELLQKSTVRETQRLIRVYNNQFLSVSEKTPNGIRAHLVNLLVVNSRPKIKIGINIYYLILSVTSTAAAMFLYSIQNVSLEQLSTSNVFTAIILLVTASLIFLVLLVRSFKFVWQFKTNYSDTPVIEILRGNPTGQTARAFTNELSQIISSLAENNYYSQSQNLAAELNELRRLRDEKIITSARYDNAKTYIMKLHAGS